jgi:hypothetical protein
MVAALEGKASCARFMLWPSCDCFGVFWGVLGRNFCDSRMQAELEAFSLPEAGVKGMKGTTALVMTASGGRFLLLCHPNAQELVGPPF